MRQAGGVLNHVVEVFDVAGVDAVRAPGGEPTSCAEIWAVSARIGTSGRSRAMRKAVAPEVV